MVTKILNLPEPSLAETRKDSQTIQMREEVIVYMLNQFHGLWRFNNKSVCEVKQLDFQKISVWTEINEDG